MKLSSQIVSLGTVLLFLCMGCNNDYSRDPHLMFGHWNSLQGKPDLTIDKDSLGYYVIVHHNIINGGKCPLRYPLVYWNNSTYIKAQAHILLVYSKKDRTLFLSPGGKYCRSQFR